MRHPSRFRVLICAVLACTLLTVPSAASSKPHRSLKKQIETILAQPDLSRGFWGIEIASATSGKVLYSLNADKLFTPASNTKLFTTAAALALIGPNYKFRTTVETSGSLDKYGRLTGDVSLVGRGDPTLSGRELPYNTRTQRDADPVRVLEQLADELAQKGVKYIDGDVVADDSYFAFERYGEGWSQDDLVWADGAPVSALTINDNVVFVNILPGAHPGDKAFVSITPFADYYTIDNRLMTTPAGTGRRIYINREPGSTKLTLWGTMPVDDSGANEGLAIEDPAEFAATLFRHLLEVRGIAVYGKERTRHTELASLSTFTSTVVASGGGGSDEHSLTSPAGPLVLAEYQSAPLSEDIQVINKVSQNLHAEILLRLLGREKGTAGTVQAGLEVLRGFLNNAGIPSDEYDFHDGSGLSRENLATPHAIVQLLQFATTQPWGKEFRDSLPAAGMDGSLADRFKDLSPAVHVYGKTGALGGVKSLAGYAVTSKGEQLVFSIVSNNLSTPAKRVTDVIDSIVEAAVQNSAK
ncbi:MAG TPA: D-alanyl-D-alanine carboxypeptidase/D-alanyl-D-alanine-endopeptidase [Terriglobales bacterium]|nr:D-alanyl-D-alanine carboxypeptidase/D-alanyl-D-alanine-endopeptidase [Terriglobales bacterium]